MTGTSGATQPPGRQARPCNSLDGQANVDETDEHDGKGGRCLVQTAVVEGAQPAHGPMCVWEASEKESEHERERARDTEERASDGAAGWKACTRVCESPEAAAGAIFAM